MNEPTVPTLAWGQQVTALVDLHNDGSFPGHAGDALLVQAGEVGEIVRTGVHEETNVAVYLVEFGPDRVVGCLDGEIAAR